MRSRAWLCWSCMLVCWAALFVARAARADTLQAPAGGRAFSIGNARVGCHQPGGGWILDASGHYLRPPLSTDAIGKAVELKIAADASRCGASSTVITLVTTARWPVIDLSTVVFAVDDGRVEARGRNLRGVGIAWRSSPSAIDICDAPRLEPNAEHCTWNMGHGLPADPDGGALSWVPAGAHFGPDVVTFGMDGKQAPVEAFVLVPARVLLDRLLPPDSAIDLSSGRGEVPLVHPDAVMSVSCGAVNCEVSGGKLLVRGLSNVRSFIDVTFKLLPKAFLQREGGALEPQGVAHLAVLHCPMSVVSGSPLRGVDSAQTVVRIEGRCAEDVEALRFLVGGEALEVVRTEIDPPGADVLLKLGRFDEPTLSIVAVRREDQSNAVAVARTDTIAPPNVHTSLELPGYPNLDFIPSNRPAIVHLPRLPGGAYLEVLPVENVYRVQRIGDAMAVQGEPNAAGLTALSLGYRNSSLRGVLGHDNLAVLTDPLQRNIKEANVPAPIDVSAFSARPLIELLCSDEGRTFRVKPGETANIPFAARDNCRVLFHRERLSPEYGTQKLSLDIDVVNLDGVSRPEGHVSQTVVLRAGRTPRLAWIRGVKDPFDRIIVRLSHSADEAHYVGALEIPSGAPAILWTIVLGTGRARLYATTAIPTGLYRFGGPQHSGLLSLNFGIVSRLTWLNEDGHEGLLGLEAGVMAFGLTNTTGQPATQVGAVGGIGLSVPIANRSSPTQASINLHGWVEMNVGKVDTGDRRYAIIFGPSISIGNVGTNL